jgi:putative membrane protein
MKRPALILLGLLVLAALWLGPVPRLAATSFAAHMTLHMGVVAIAAPLLALGLAGGAFDPVRRVPRFFPPVPLSIVELAAVWAWHAPALHHLARNTTAGFVAEQGTFILVGALVWLSGFGGGGDRAQERRGAALAALLLTSMHMTLLGALLALSPRPLYRHAEVCALSPLDDQHLGGAIMLLVGGVVYLAGGAWLAFSLLRGRSAPRLREALP